MKLTRFTRYALALLVLSSTAAIADEGRYQAYWNGKSYMILDTDRGNMWTFYGDTLVYNGRLDGDDFESPDKASIWKQNLGKWVKQK